MAKIHDTPVRHACWWAGSTAVGIAAVVVAGAVQLHHVIPLIVSLCPG